MSNENIRIFSSEHTKLFYEVARGERMVDIHNYDALKHLIMPMNIVVMTRGDIIKNITNFIEINDASIIINDTQVRKLIEDPFHFTIKSINNSPTKIAEQLAVSVSTFINKLIFNYSCLVATNDFLLARCNSLSSQLNDANLKFVDSTKPINTIEELKSFNESEIVLTAKEIEEAINEPVEEKTAQTTEETGEE